MDWLRQHTTWYGYDHNGRIDTVWTRLTSIDSGLSIKTPKYRADQAKPAQADIAYKYTKTGQVQSMEYLPVLMLTEYAYNHRKWLDSMVTWYQTPPPFPSTAQLFKEVLTYDLNLSL